MIKVYITTEDGKITGVFANNGEELDVTVIDFDPNKNIEAPTIQEKLRSDIDSYTVIQQDVTFVDGDYYY